LPGSRDAAQRFRPEPDGESGGQAVAADFPDGRERDETIVGHADADGAGEIAAGAAQIINRAGRPAS